MHTQNKIERDSYNIANKQALVRLVKKKKKRLKHGEQERRGEDRNRSGRLTGMTFQVQRTGVRV